MKLYQARTEFHLPLQVLFLTLFASINRYQHTVAMLTEMHTALHTPLFLPFSSQNFSEFIDICNIPHHKIL
jgi:hypothetical protein